MVDNFEIIKPLLKFNNSDEFYFLQIIQRKKDFIKGQERHGRDNNSRLIRAYYIYSAEQLEDYKEEIIKLCELFNARAGINLNKRNNKDVAIKCLEILAIAMRKNDEFKGISKIYSSACGKERSTDKLWIVDIDNMTYDEIFDVINYFSIECMPEGNKLISKIPSKNGVHLITTKFDRKKFSEKYPTIEIHCNNPTNLYIP